VTAQNQPLLSRRLREVRASLPYLPRALRLVYEASGKWSLAWFVLIVLQGVLPVALVLLTRVLVDSVVAVAGTGASWTELRQPLLYAALMGLVLLAQEVLGALAQWCRTTQAELVADHIRARIQLRASTLDMAFYESSDYFDILHRARVDAQNRPAALVENLGALAQSTLTLIAMAAVLTRFGCWLPVALVVSTLPALLVVVRAVVRLHEWKVRTTTDSRRTLYYEHVTTTREPFPEVRLFDLAGHFRGLFDTLRGRLRSERFALARREATSRITAGLLALVVMAAALAWMLLRALRGAISLGELAMFGQAFLQGQRLLRILLETTGQLYSNILFLQHLFELLDLEPAVLESPSPRPLPDRLNGSIAFRDVRFRYPGSDHEVFRGLDLEIPAGTVVALLGPNGAGKSTLFKLLCRYYDPTGGAIELDGIDLRHVPLDDLRRRIGVLFQEPLHFNETVRDNIDFGDLQNAGDMERVRRAARAAGADTIVDRLPDGYETVLGRWFGTTELSVGEWQRIALARCFVRDGDILLLDEPTSAMDSWAEADWMGRFLDLARGRTAIVITHRLTTAMRADVIHVLQHGRVLESGSHDELIAGGGLYAHSFHLQFASRSDEPEVAP